MKEFLESLYEIENFGIYLFVVIGVLVVLFLLVLFFGKKSADERLEEFEEKENDNVNAFKTIENEVARKIVENKVKEGDIVEIDHI